MHRGRFARALGRFVVIACALCLGGVCSPPARAAIPVAAPLRVLLVGNSYTKFNMMPRLLSRLSSAVHGVRALHVDFQVHGGFSLREHWRAGIAAERIRHGHYDFVVLQGHSLSAVNHPDELDEYATRFEHLIAESGARTVLYQTWPRKEGSREYQKNEHVHTFDEMAERIDGEYSSLAARLGARLAPVGRAFVHAVVTEPTLALYRSDDSHPTPAGSFLAACVLYGALTGEDPRGSRYVPFGSTPSAAEEIKALAAAVLTDSVPAAPAPPAAVPEPGPALELPEPQPGVMASSMPPAPEPAAPEAALESLAPLPEGAAELEPAAPPNPVAVAGAPPAPQ